MPRRFALLLLIPLFASLHALAAPDPWLQIASQHFTVITNSSDKQGRHILDQFERMRWLFQTLFPKSKVDAPQPIIVIAVKNQRDFQSLEPAAYLGRGQIDLDGLFLRTQENNYVLLRLDTEGDHPYATIYHEYTHLQFRDAGDWMPLWLNEGFAEFIQNTEIRNKDVLLGEPSVDNILYLRQNRLLPLPTLFKVDYTSPYYHEEQKASVFYAESWALTHYLEITDRERGTHRMPDYVALVRQHQDPVTAAETAFGDLKTLQSALESYISAGSYKQFLVSSAAAPLDESAYQSRPLTQAQADADRADFLANVDRPADARALLDNVLKAEPDNSQAHETMGFLSQRAGDMDAARKWYGEAVTLNPRSFLASYQFATLSMRTGNTAGGAEIEGCLRAAIRLNPDFAPAYDQLAGWFAMRHEHLDEAHSLNLRAIELDPAEMAFRMNASSVLMTMGRYADAAAVLRAAAKVAKNPSETAMLQNRLTQIESIQALGARPSSMITRPPTGTVDIQTVETVAEVKPPKHLTEPFSAARHQALGVIRNIQCSYPAEVEFNLVTDKKPISPYSNNYLKIDLTVLGFTPKGDMNPCTDFEGRKARIQYAESSDKTVDGQVVAIELRK